MQMDDFAWDMYSHAYGIADDIPLLLQRLNSKDSTLRDEAVNELFGCLCHQGTIYSASEFVIPFLVEKIAYVPHNTKNDLVGLLALMAMGDPPYDFNRSNVVEAERIAFRVTEGVTRVASQVFDLCPDGEPRKALVMLAGVCDIKDKAPWIRSLQASDTFEAMLFKLALGAMGEATKKELQECAQVWKNDTDLDLVWRERGRVTPMVRELFTSYL